MGAQLQYTCRCSFLQIYNEQVSDLLQVADKPLALRHDATHGVFAEGLSEHVVVNGATHPPSSCAREPCYCVSGAAALESRYC